MIRNPCASTKATAATAMSFSATPGRIMPMTNHMTCWLTAYRPVIAGEVSLPANHRRALSPRPPVLAGADIDTEDVAGAQLGVVGRGVGDDVVQAVARRDGVGVDDPVPDVFTARCTISAP